MIKLRRDHELPLLLGVLSAVLASLLALEWVYKQRSYQDVRANLAKVSAVLPQDTEDTSGSVYWLADAERFDEIGQRPLFFHGRKIPTQSASGPALDKKPFDAQLHGVLDTPGGVWVFLRSKDGHYHRLHPHDIYLGWELDEVQPDRVFFARDGSRKELLLQKPKPKDKPAAPPKQAPNGEDQIPQEGIEVPQEEVKTEE